MKAHLCGLWDGANLWLQWEDVAPEAGYRLRVRSILSEDWTDIGGIPPLRKAWMVLPMWTMHGTEGHPGATVEAQVAVATDGPLEWVTATEVTFARSRCRFEFRAGPRGIHYPKSGEFSCIVDGAGAHYALQEEIELADGELAEMELVATLLTGYCQLDRPGDFLLRPALGTEIRNIAASEDDIEETGAMSTALRVMPRKVGGVTPGGQPLKIAFGPRLF